MGGAPPSVGGPLGEVGRVVYKRGARLGIGWSGRTEGLLWLSWRHISSHDPVLGSLNTMTSSLIVLAAFAGIGEGNEQGLPPTISTGEVTPGIPPATFLRDPSAPW